MKDPLSMRRGVTSNVPKWMEDGHPGPLGHLATRTVSNSAKDNVSIQPQSMEGDTVRVEKIWHNRSVLVGFVSQVYIP